MTRPGPTIPERLAVRCEADPARQAWLRALPAVLADLRRRWSLALEPPFDGPEVSCAWVAPAKRDDGSLAVLKVGLPHMEAEHEIDGLRFWNGDPTVRLLEADDERNAMLLERCVPGTHLRSRPPSEQDRVIASMLRRLWREPAVDHPFRTLAEMIRHWSDEALADADRWPDRKLTEAGLRLFDELPRTADRHVVLATDLHAGNILQSGREPWLVIDPKPFVGDPAYDATQHLLNIQNRLRDDPLETIRRFARLLDIDPRRIRLWTFARLAAEPRESWVEYSRLALARALQP